MSPGRLSLLAAVLCLARAGCSQQMPAAPSAPFDLRCEYLVAPPGGGCGSAAAVLGAGSPRARAGVVHARRLRRKAAGQWPHLLLEST